MCMLSCFSHVWLFATPRTVARQALLSIEYSSQEYWRRLPFLTPGDYLDSGIEHVSPALAGRFFTTAPPGKPFQVTKIYSSIGIIYLLVSPKISGSEFIFSISINSRGFLKLDISNTEKIILNVPKCSAPNSAFNSCSYKFHAISIFWGKFNKQILDISKMMNYI